MRHISNHYRSRGFSPRLFRTAIGEIRQNAGNSAVIPSMDGIHEVMISSDTHVYARSARCTYPDTIGEAAHY